MKYLFALMVSIVWIVGPASASGQILSFTNIKHTQTVTIDRDVVQNRRISQVNQLRSGLGLRGYQAHPSLQQTAQTRSHRAHTLGMISHRRPGSQAYYSYPAIIKWFGSQDVQFSGTGTLVVENIGYGYLKCRKKDCTDELIQAMQSTWKFFVSEKTKKYQPHYRSMISPVYTLAGVGVSIDLDLHRYYLTAHYSQSIK